MTGSGFIAKVLGVALLAATAPVALDAGSASTASGATIHVALNGNDSANGSTSSPLRTIGRAVAIAGSGSTILVGTGSYHESVQVYGKDVDIVAATGATVVLDGARTVTGFSKVSGTNAWFTTWNAHFARTSGDMIDPARPMAAFPDQAFRDGAPLTQVSSLSRLTAGTFFVDDAARRLYVGSDPSGHRIEASDLAWGLYFNKANGSSLQGITVRRYATPASDMAAVRVYSNDMTVADTTVEQNAYMGISTMGANVTLARVTARDNAYIGVHGHLAPNFTLRDSTVVRNNAAGFDSWHSGAGVKVTTSRVVNYWSNEVSDNTGPGLWTDLGVSYASIVGNLVEGNSYSGIIAELSGHVVVADNTVLDSGQAGVWVLESNDVEVWHNALYRNDRDVWVEDGPRVDPSRNADAISDVARISIHNNTMGQGRSGVQAVLAADDWTENRSARSMGITSDHNAFWMPKGTTTNLSRWARWPNPLAINATLDTHRSVTGQDAHSVVSTATTNPFARNMAGYDLRTSGLTGAATTSTVAASLGVAPGTRLAVGPRSVLIPRTEVRVTQPPTAVTETYTALDATRYFTTRVSGNTFDGYWTGTGRLAAGSVTEVQLAGRGQVPVGATSVKVRLISRSATTGDITISACGVAAPASATHHVVAGQRTIATAVVDPGVKGRICVYSSQPARLSIDVLGYWTPA